MSKELPENRKELEAKITALKSAHERIKLFHNHLKGHQWYPHEGQVELIRAVFNDGKTDAWAQCGRSFGKSHAARYIATRYALSRPNSACYVVAPERKQAYEIHWIAPDNNITTAIPRELLLDGDEAFNKSELRINFKNGSFIKLDGSDNISALRGYKPHLFIADEFQSWKPEAWQAMEPNFIANQSTVVRIGTPPDRECYYTEQLAFFQKQERAGHPRYFFMRMPTASNPKLDKERLEELRRGFLERGEEAIWRREYMAEFVPGGASAVFGTLWDRTKTVVGHGALLKALEGDINQLKWFTICDPGTTSCFAVLFCAYNPYTAELFLLDEIYERDRNKTSSTQIWQRIEQREKLLCPQAQWRRYADEAAAWFINEISFNYRISINKTNKAVHSKESMIGLFKDVLLHELVRVSDKCKMFMFEIENYVTDDRNRLPDKDDHLLDCLFYALSACNYKLVEKLKKRDPGLPARWTPLDEINRKELDSDWTRGLDERYFDA